MLLKRRVAVTLMMYPINKTLLLNGIIKSFFKILGLDIVIGINQQC